MVRLRNLEKGRWRGQGAKWHSLHPTLALLCALALQQTVAFNVNLDDVQVLQPPSQTGIHFGFSLAHFVNGTERRLLVGAPLANTTKDVSQPGALYTCDLGSSPSCTQLEVDWRNTDDKYKSWISEDKKEHQGLGFSVVASEEIVVVCAPRWHAYESVTGGLKDLASGICFSARAPNFDKFTAFSPAYDVIGMNTKFASYDNNGTCQVGLSVSYSQETETVSFGSPGCWSWQGDVWNIHKDTLTDKDTFHRAQKIDFKDVDLTSSPDGRYSSLADLYLGYSVASITYASKPAVVSAMPRAVSTHDLRVVEKNKVFGPVILIFEEDQSKLNVLDTIKPPLNESNNFEATKDSMFSYFGYSLTTADVNGDGLDDLVVGAPLYHNDSHHDQGAVFVYMQKRFDYGGDGVVGAEMKLEPNSPLRMGHDSYGRFGSCVASVGDLGGDGYQDIAVGAPFLESGGKVFIYLGSRDGLGKTPSQVIDAMDMPSSVRPLDGFGFAIAQKMPDATGNGFDLGIGVFNSDKVLVFKTKEVIAVEWNVTFSGKMNLTSSTCIMGGDTSAGKYPCVDMKTCFLYRVLNTKTKTKQTLEFTIKLEADIKQQKKRLLFNNGRAETNLIFNQEKDQMSCQEEKVYAKRDIEELIQPFVIQAEVDMKGASQSVILDEQATRVLEEELPILVQCEGGVADKCESDLELTYTSNTTYALKKMESIPVTFRLTNRGEVAYNTRLVIYSNGDLISKEQADSAGGVVCETKHKPPKIECKIDAIFKKGEKEFEVVMMPHQNFFSSLERHLAFFTVEAEAETTSVQKNPDAAKTKFQIPIIVKGNLDLTKENSNPSHVSYNSSYDKSPAEASNEQELGEQVIHKYKIYNRQPYSIYSTKLTISWPLKIDGLYLLYLLDNPTITGIKASCHYENGEVDKYNITDRIPDPTEETTFSRGPASVAVRHGARKSDSNIDYMVITCILGELGESSQVFIELRSRLVQKTLGQSSFKGGEIKSFAQAQAILLPLNATPPDATNSSVGTLISNIPSDTIPWWVYLLAALGGLILLLIIVLILWKCGYFERKRVETADETEGEGDTKEKPEDEVEHPTTPQSPMLKETEMANDDFTFSRTSSLQPV